jgi:hypothetical protein
MVPLGVVVTAAAVALIPNWGVAILVALFFWHLATGLGLGTVSPSSDIARFVQGGVVKTLRCRSLVFCDFDVHFLPASQDPDDLDRIISFDVEHYMVGEIFHKPCPQSGKLGNTGCEWATTFGMQHQASNRLLGSLKKSQCSINTAVRDVHCVGFDIVDSFGPSSDWFPVRHLLDAL